MEWCGFIDSDNYYLKNQGIGGEGNGPPDGHVRRGRPKGRNPDSVRERLIGRIVHQLGSVEWGSSQEIIQAALAALDGSWNLLGVSERGYLRDTRDSQQGFVRLVREIAERAASQRSKRVHVTARMVEDLRGTCFASAARNLTKSQGSQGRSPRSGLSAQRETLDWQSPKTLVQIRNANSVSGCHPGEGIAFHSLSIHNEGVGTRDRLSLGLSTYHISPQGIRAGESGPLLPAGDEDSTGNPSSAYASDKYYYQKR